MTNKIVILAALSGFWLLSTFNSAPADFSYYDRLFIAVLFILVLTAQTATIAACQRLLGGKATNIALAIFTAANMAIFYLVFYAPFASLTPGFQLAALAATIWIANGCWSLLAEMRQKKLTALAAVLLFGYAATQAVLAEQKISAGGEYSATAQAGMTSSSNIRIVDFVKKPNVYFLSFDSLIPRSLAVKNLRLNHLAYQDVMEKSGFRIFRNFFVDAVYTRKSLSNFLSLGYNYYSEEEEEENIYIYADSYIGRIPSPLLEIFKANGYTTNAYYNDTYFGWFKGEYMDNYHTNIPFAACSFLPGTAAHVGFGGYCPLLAIVLKINLFGIAESIKPSYADFLVHHFANALSAQEHSVFIAYIWSPGHVFPDYYHRPEQFTQYRRKFSEGDKTAADRINTIMKFIKQNDPEALVFIFGDHGPRLTDQFPWEDMNTEADKVFFIHDRYGVLGGVYPREACEDSFARPYKPDYNTPAQVGRQIVRCLAGGEDPLLASPPYDLDYDREGYRGKTPLRYEDYLYE